LVKPENAGHQLARSVKLFLEVHMRRHSRRLWWLSVCAVLLSIAAIATAARDHLAPRQPKPGNAAEAQPGMSRANQLREPARSLYLRIDGTKTPELIPDSLAYEHFLMATALPSGTATKDDLSRHRFLLGRAKLTDEEIARFEVATASVHEDLADAALLLDHASAPHSDAAAQFRERQSEILASARLRVAEALGQDAMDRLDTYVRTHVKSRITIYSSEHTSH
jgi:hypothetical protein